MEQVVVVVGVGLAAVGVLGLLYIAGMRRRSPLVHRPLIALQRAVINPRQLRSAGTPGAYASIIRHVGRTSGRSYQTPVGAVATDDGFVIGLVYGSGSSWVRNVLASGSATIVHQGRTYRVDRPDVVPMQAVAARFDAGDQRGFRILGVDQALRLRRADAS